MNAEELAAALAPFRKTLADTGPAPNEAGA
jgi:hypothetical protein